MDDYTQQSNSGIDKKKLIIKIAIIILAAFVIISSLLIGYKYFKNKQTGQESGGSLFPSVSEVVNLITGKEEVATSSPIISDDQKLVELYKGPVGGYTILSDGSAIRLFDRAKGLIIDINLKTGEQKTVTDQPILKVHDVTFIGDTSIITRSLEDNTIKSNLYSFTQNNDTGILITSEQPTTLSDNILELAKSLNNKYVALVIKDINGSNIDLLDTETRNLKRQISLPISEWLPSVTNSGEVFISAKASKYANSGTYKIVDGILNTIVPSKTAQTSILSPDGLRIVSIAIYDNLLSSELTSKKDTGQYTGSDSGVDLHTIAEKCTWNSLNTMIFCGVPKTISKNIPDDWYLGQAHYNDTIYKYDVFSDQQELIVNPDLNKMKIDVVSPEVRENNLFFKDKLNEHLFAYRLSENVDIEKQYEINNETEINNPE